MSEKISRRTFLKRSTVAGATAGMLLATKTPGYAQTDKSDENTLIGSLIDLTKCDGCAAYDTPLCVTACRQKNEHRFPQPQKPIKDYWPQKKHEDWSNEKDRTDRLTPYNWTYVEKVQVNWNGKTKDVAIPRRCMHCLDAPCQKLCPFGVIEKTKHGAVKIDENFCMGGAKCRAVCPWDIPQRQAGVGLYMKLVPELAGGGVMYKCDMCADLLEEGKSPACETACPRGAIEFGPYEQIRKKAYERAKEIDGFIYGDVENSGTLTLYVSDVPFDKIDEAIEAKKKAENDTRFGRPHMKPEIENMLETTHGYMLATLIAPIAGAAAAGITAYKVLSGQKKKEGEKQHESKEEK
ncbi:Fe-S-cluster-containing dehydrogenase component [Anoxybacillus tengchongensis]|uniref:Fe-S-cluster-containing dehydrogenase component n=1 Tax=Anoxybacillus tengchongensis TaxID=576944 RepID=A0A7X0D9Z8_9BACL|nr:4Fe-4S dicluster domain-containing protein [Anoxybacillus tengchongensis]MBB6177020.1 Fe-S-cluster-containing dehydrogenase component [Anoxybacillus tengchongensis]